MHESIKQKTLHVATSICFEETAVRKSPRATTTVCVVVLGDRVRLEEDGYVVLEQFLLPNECEELKAAGSEFTKTLTEDDIKLVFSTIEEKKQMLKDEYFIDSNDKIRHFFEEEALDSDGKLKVDKSIALNKVGHALHLLHPIFRCYSYSDRVKSVCGELGLRDPAIVQSMYIYKNPGIGGEDPIPPVGFWIALEDATVQNGCLWIARGSHKSGVHRRLKLNRDDASQRFFTYDNPPAFYPESSFTPVPVPKGACVLLHGHVVHRSAPNKSEKSRHAYTFHVVERENNRFSEDNWLQEGPGAPFSNVYTTKQIE